MSTKYGYICTNHDLPDDYIDLDYLPAAADENQYVQVIEDVRTESLEMIGRGNKEIIHAGNLNIALPEEARQAEIHLALMKQLIDRIPNGSLVMFHTIHDLSASRPYGISLYHKFLSRNIELSFSRQSTLNSDSFKILGDRNSGDIQTLIDILLLNGYTDLDNAAESFQLSPEVSQLSNDAKKNLQ